MSLLDQLAAAGALGPLDLRFAAALGRLAGVTDPRVLAGAALANHAPTDGHVCVDLAAVGGLVEVELPDAAAWAAALGGAPALVRPAGAATPTPLVLDGHRLYLDRTWVYQRRLIAAIRRRVEGPPPAVDEPALAHGLAALFSGDPREARQRQAAERAVRSRFTVVAGGPGTGKTAVVVKMLALLNAQSPHAHPRVALLAPTGKAAARLTESIRDTVEQWIPKDLRQDIPTEASTIHRALRWIWNTPRFRHDADNPLPVDVVVVDEASMVDLPLMAKLVDAVPDSARLILLGDPDQLVSVELGSVLGDICAAAPALDGAVVHLEHTWRYPPDSGIHALAQAIHRGDADRALAVLADPAHPDVERLDVSAGPAAFDARLRDLALHGYRPAVTATEPQAALRALRAFRVLCAHRQGLRGVARLNREIEAWLASAGLVEPDQPWYAGRPILVTHNDNRLQLYNGDVGVILPLAGSRRAFFDGGDAGLRDFNPALIPSHDTVFATTVHKGQGSEYDHVVTVLPDEPGRLVTRELLYTAVTRARTRVTVLGSSEVVAAGVAAQVVRMSGFADGLRGHGQR
jgi:exodeoxyribonuclease V alpha subunit